MGTKSKGSSQLFKRSSGGTRIEKLVVILCQLDNPNDNEDGDIKEMLFYEHHTDLLAYSIPV